MHTYELTNEEYGYLKTLSTEDKYNLYNECEFLVRNNYAKLNYISEGGFGKTLVRFVTGRSKKARMKILENNNELQKKMKNILDCLDDEMLNNKMRLKYHTHSLITLHLRILALIEKITGHIEYMDEFIAENFPKFKKLDKAEVEAEIEYMRQDINAEIAKLNSHGEKQYNRFEKAMSTRILRITPWEATIITKDGIEDIVPVRGEHKYHYAVDADTVKSQLEKENCNVAVLPEVMKKDLPGITMINTADYFMYLWFINTPPSERKGRTVGILDMHDRTIYVYGYEVSSDGSKFSRLPIINNDIWFERNRYNIKHDLQKMFGGSFATTLFFRTFLTVYKNLEDRLNDKKECADINIVKPFWEHRFYADEGEELIKLVHNHIGKVYDDEEQQVFVSNLPSLV